MKKENGQTIIYQKKSGEIAFRGDVRKETFWATQKQISEIFECDRSVITKHIRNILKDQELQEKSVCANFAHTAEDGKVYQVSHYNLDMILSVGYRVNSKRATVFRQWATKVLREHLTKGYTINRQQVAKNYEAFLRSVEDVKKLLPQEKHVDVKDVLDLVRMFASTWLSLDSYDRSDLPTKGVTKKHIRITAEELSQALAQFKKELIEKGEATELFGKEQTHSALEGIVDINPPSKSLPKIQKSLCTVFHKNFGYDFEKIAQNSIIFFAIFSVSRSKFL